MADRLTTADRMKAVGRVWTGAAFACQIATGVYSVIASIYWLAGGRPAIWPLILLPIAALILATAGAAAGGLDD